MNLGQAEKVRVYQEGRGSWVYDSATCPYGPNDWRAVTWNNGRKAALEEWSDVDEIENQIDVQSSPSLPKPAEQDELVDFVERSMRLAFLLGQTYWAQADSASVNRRRLSKETRQAFIELREETRLTVGAGRVLK